ncbi:hypothetical protein P2318_10535 [Myxococcaceae bacterium GXIMD 01537]
MVQPHSFVASTGCRMEMGDLTQTHLRGLRVCLVVAAAAALSMGCGGGLQGDSATQAAVDTGVEDSEMTLESLGGNRGGDSLYIGDVADDTVKRFDAKTGAFQGTFVTAGSGGLSGPRGLLFGPRGDLVLVNQNANQPFPGAVFEYDGRTGDFLRALVPHTDSKAPFTPRGIVRKGHRLYVADMGSPEYVLGDGPPPNPQPARVEQYDERTGEWLGDLSYAGFGMSCSAGTCVQWSPRAVVFGPDGALYVSVMKFMRGADPNVLPGRVIRFPRSGHGDGSVFIDGENCNGCGLARPDGLVFGPDGKLYVTSFRKGDADNDKILLFNGKTGAYEDKIDLDVAGQPRAFAQAILFGPGGKLYVPISGGGPDAGSVRRYDVDKKPFEFDVFVPPGGNLIAPWYLTFGKTHPAKLTY